MTCAYLLKVNGTWAPLDGVRPGIAVTADRRSSELRTVGGRRYVSRSRRAAREWSLDFAHATPEAVRLLALAANGQGGDVMLLDVSQARANMLDPRQAIGPTNYPLLDCGGVMLPSVVASDISAETRVAPIANRWVSTAALPASTERLVVRNGTADSWVKFAVPAAQTGRVLTSARLELTLAAGPTPTLRAHLAGNAWTEGYGTDYNDLVGTTFGTAAYSSAINGWSISLSSLLPYQAVDLSLRIRSQTTATDPTYLVSRANPTTGPRLVLTYAVASSNHTFSVPIRGGVRHFWSAYTNAPAGTEIATSNYGGATFPLLAPAGTGPRLAVAEVPSDAADKTLVGTVPGSLTSRVSALRVTEGPHVGAWVPGQKVPVRVAIDDPAQTLNTLFDGEHGRSDYQVTLREVG